MPVNPFPLYCLILAFMAGVAWLCFRSSRVLGRFWVGVCILTLVYDIGFSMRCRDISGAYEIVELRLDPASVYGDHGLLRPLAGGADLPVGHEFHEMLAAHRVGDIVRIRADGTFPYGKFHSYHIAWIDDFSHRHNHDR